MPSVLPMLAVAAEPFDDPEYLFQIKWDGVRALSEVSQGAWRVWGREGQDYTARYPELEALRQLPDGTVLDGELVVVRQGRADFSALMSRHQRQGARTYPHTEPVRYVVFDLLYHRGKSVLREPLSQRRLLLKETLPECPVLLPCQGVIGTGRDCFAQAVAAGQEGLVAKRLQSVYVPGKRSSAWRKIKPVMELLCVVLGYRMGPAGLKDLLLGAVREGALRYIGTVESGLPRSDDLLATLQARGRSKPLVPCPHPAHWVEPERFCKVRFHGWRSSGGWRDPVFAGWLREK